MIISLAPQKSANPQSLATNNNKSSTILSIYIAAIKIKTRSTDNSSLAIFCTVICTNCNGADTINGLQRQNKINSDALRFLRGKPSPKSIQLLPIPGHMHFLLYYFHNQLKKSLN